MRRITLLATLLTGALATAAPAAAGPVEDFREDGIVDTCQYSPGQLDEARQNLPPDVVQYSPGLVDQLAAGQEGCGGAGAPGAAADPREFEDVATPEGADGVAGAGGGGGGGGRASGATTRIPSPPAPGAAARARLADVATPPVSATPGSDVPGWVVVVLLALAGAGVLFTLGRFGGLSAERFTGPLKASFADAGGRSADAAAAGWDRLRPGR